MSDQITSREAEEAVLGGLLLDSSRFDEVDDILEPGHFTGGGRSDIFVHVRDQFRRREVADAITVGSAHPDLSDYAWELYQATPGTAMLRVWANLVREKWILRQAAMIGMNLATSCRGNDTDAIDEAVKLLMGLRKTSAVHQFTARNALETAYAQVREASERPEGLVGLPTGIAEMDMLLGGFHPTDLTVFGARPGIGKTSLLLGAARAGAVKGPVALFSGEQPHHQLGIRMLAAQAQISLQRMRNGQLRTDSEWARTATAVQQLSQLPIHIDDTSKPDIRHIQRVARKMKHEHDIKAAYVDYVQIIKAKELKKAERHEVVGFVTSELKEMGKELGISVIALAQLDRKADESKRPLMSHLSNSSEIEKEADQIGLIWRDQTMPKAIVTDAEINFVKQRHGIPGTVFCKWHGASTSFVSKARGDEIEMEYEERKRAYRAAQNDEAA